MIEPGTIRVLRLGLWLAIVLLAWGLVANEVWGQIPADAGKYKRDLIRNSRVVWGLDAPVSTFAGQIHQESGWHPDAVSPVGASGLAQFMPSTATWISGAYDTLGDNQPTNPAWAIRALVQYDKWLYDRVPPARSHCERMAFVLSGYNGGGKWLERDVAACKMSVCVSGPRQSVRTYPLTGFIRVPFPEEVILRPGTPVLTVVLTMGKHLQVLRQKVSPVLVSMMNEDLARQFRAQQMFGYKPMHIQNLARSVDTWVPVVPEDSLVRGYANLPQDGTTARGKVRDIQAESSCVKCDSTAWFNHVEKFNGGRSDSAFKENRSYPRRILLELERRYVNDGWGIKSC